MRSNMYTNENDDLSKLEEHLHNGTILSAYQFRLPIQRVGREKMIVSRNFNSFSGTHMCFYCKQRYVPTNVARVAHFRDIVPKGSYEYSDTLSNKTELLQQELHLLFD